MNEPKGYYGPKKLTHSTGGNAPAARLSHERGADAEAEWEALRAAMGGGGIGGRARTIIDEHRPLIEAALSVPAPTLPALDAVRERLTDAISGERQHWHRVEADPRDIASLLSVPAPTLPALDAETLARALPKALQLPFDNDPKFAGREGNLHAVGWAKSIIREYEALRDAV